MSLVGHSTDFQVWHLKQQELNLPSTKSRIKMKGLVKQELDFILFHIQRKEEEIMTSFELLQILWCLPLSSTKYTLLTDNCYMQSSTYGKKKISLPILRADSFQIMRNAKIWNVFCFTYIKERSHSENCNRHEIYSVHKDFRLSSHAVNCVGYLSSL